MQCIPNPKIPNGFITVQIIEPKYTVSNKFGQDEVREKEVVEEEIDTVRLPERSKNDRFRFSIYHYGEVKETDPSVQRNAKQIAVISFVEYT